MRPSPSRERSRGDAPNEPDAHRTPDAPPRRVAIVAPCPGCRVTAGALTPAGLPRAAAARVDGTRFDLARTVLPPPLRPGAELAVLDVTEFYGDTSGGVRTYLDRKAAYVAARPALRQTVLVPGERDALDDGDGVRLYQLGGPRVPMRPPYRFMLALRQPRRVAEHERPDVIEVGSPGLVPWLVRHATRRTGAPLVHFWHSHYPRQLAGLARGGVRGAFGAARGALAWAYARRLDRAFALTFVASDFAAGELRAAGVDRVARVPLGVDLGHFHPRRRAHAVRTRARAGLPVGAPLAVYVGRFAAEKRLDVLLRAWPRVRRRTGARLALVGAGPERGRLAGLIDAAGAICVPFERERGALADLITAADLYVAPGPIETFGLAVLEALACATPVLAVDAGGAGELVARSGGGARFAPGDPDALADAAESLLDLGAHGLHALGHAGRAYAEREHGWDAVFDRLFGHYRDVAAGRWGR